MLRHARAAIGSGTLARHPRHPAAAAAAATLAPAARRHFMLDASPFMDKWPRTQANTLVNVCPQGERMVVERLGKLEAIKESGWFLAIPFIDRIAYIIDMREKALEIQPQAAITKDNVSVDVSGNVYMQARARTEQESPCRVARDRV